MPTPFPHQLSGASFLAERKAALLADDPRVGKTGAAIIACDYVFARKILVVTTSSGRPNWAREFRDWGFPRRVQVVYSGSERVRADAEVVIVGWGMVYDKRLLPQLQARQWDVLIPDEAHYAKNPDAKRTKALYDTLAPRALFAWPLTGTPVPNGPNDLHPMLVALAPERLLANDATGWPDVTAYHAFVRRYCTVKPRWVAGRRIDVVTGGKNLDELRERLDGFWLRRTQQDVGIGRPIFSLFTVTPGNFGSGPLKAALADIDPLAGDILAAAEAGDTATLEMHMGPLRRITGQMKAYAVIEALKEEFEDGMDKIVLMAWHSDVLKLLAEGLSQYGVVGIDGATPPTIRQRMVDIFQRGDARVFCGQIQAAGEAIDLSSSANLMFVEPSFTPKDLAQAAMRITNHTQTRQALVRVCALEGSIDEALMRIVTRKVASIRQLMEH
ncbi:MAG: DEAD/DEAH box helicase [Magnetospirillum gryphiswaldense]|nr:DEAD/DEAH box helicase [Magnetospirillum gryphiswaldense]